MRYAQGNCKLTENTVDAQMYHTYSGKCFITGKPHSVTVLANDVARYNEGEYLQNCFPYLSAGDREFLLTGTTEEGWSELFGEDDDD